MLPCMFVVDVAFSPLSEFSELGESSKEPMVALDQHGAQHEGELEIVQRAMEIGPLLGIACGGHGNQLLDFLTTLDKDHCPYSRILYLFLYILMGCEAQRCTELSILFLTLKLNIIQSFKKGKKQGYSQVQHL